jgi:hypothetical protein
VDLAGMNGEVEIVGGDDAAEALEQAFCLEQRLSPGG